jgi:L-alanine-DL-glutamate epimerase-like enolase superfamily enzyme
VEIISAWEDAGLNIELVEQPVHRDDLDGLAHVSAHVSTPVLADESVWSCRDLREIIQRRAAGLVNIKLAKTGGLRRALDLAQLASEHEIDVVVGCMVESHVGVAAAAALASALSSRDPARPAADDLDMGLWLTHSPVLGGVDYEAETIHLADAPGTGIIGLAD